LLFSTEVNLNKLAKPRGIIVLGRLCIPLANIRI
jgi:hypothetical protein